jgi:F-type H+-transporting ATPase subunit alpha
VKAQLDRGVRLRARLSQPQCAPLRLPDQVALAMALRDGALDDMAPDQIAAFRAALPAWIDQHAPAAVRANGHDRTAEHHARPDPV